MSRHEEISEQLKQVIGLLDKLANLKEQREARGYLNNYLSFAGRVHSLVNRAISEPLEGKKYLYALMEMNKIRFRDPIENEDTVELFTDSTMTGLGWTYGNKAAGASIVRMQISLRKHWWRSWV